jgi:hypothetical protein
MGDWPAASYPTLGAFSRLLLTGLVSGDQIDAINLTFYYDELATDDGER